MFDQNPIVKIDSLTKQFGNLRALNECSLSIDRGKIFGLLGPNGAGKTTLIRSLLGFVKPTSGSAHVDGLDCLDQSIAVRTRMAYLPAEAKLFRMMRGKQALDFFSKIHPSASTQRALDIASRLQLDLTRRVAFMSTGMRQKLAIACILACRPKLMILDEPTAALDPTVRKVVLTLIRESQQAGATVLFSSHILSEIEEICDEAAIMNQGRVVLTIDMKAIRPNAEEASNGLKKIYESCFDCS
jgi:ABC-2 type transport system ATP-binding protein